jgi:flavodoxin
LIAVTVVLLAGQLHAANAPEAVAGANPAVSPKKVLVVYYSRTGNTKKVAEDIARQLNADIERLVDKKDRSGAGGYVVAGKDATTGALAEIEPIQHDPAAYDLVVMGTPVWAWTMTPAVRTYIADHKAAFKEIAFFTSAAGSKPETTVKKMETLAGKQAEAFVGFFDREYKEKKRAAYEEKLNAFVAKLR